MDLVLYFLLDWPGGWARMAAAQAVCPEHRIAAGLHSSIHTAQSNVSRRMPPANSAFGVLSSLVLHQLALHIQLYSLCVCQSWEGAEEVILPLSLVSVKQLATGFCYQEKCLVILQSCCHFPRISPAFRILGRSQQPPPGSILHQATNVGPDSAFPLFTAERHCFSRVRALHICTESNRMWSTCSEGVKLFEGVS